jgi:hypothetical protein
MGVLHTEGDVSSAVGQRNESRAKDLREAMRHAFEDLHAAHALYEHALEIAIDTDLSSDGMLAMRNEGRTYAHAVKRYSDAVMEWLVVVETSKDNARQLLRKANGVVCN